TSISPDAIEEYRVITHDFAAEYGKAGGFVTDTVLKSGTNNWHGSLFEYNRVQALAGNDWFSNAFAAENNGIPIKDHLVRNQFGGSFGGPIVKEKTFFYSSVEFHRLRQSVPELGSAYTQQFYNFVNTGAFETFMETNPAGLCEVLTGATCPGAFNHSATVGPIFQSQLAAFPLAMPIVNAPNVTCPPAPNQNPACFGQGAYTGNSLGIGFPKIYYPVPEYQTATESLAEVTNQYRISVKVDHKLSPNDQIGGVYLLENVLYTDNFGLGAATFGVPTDNPNRAQTAGVTYTHTFSPTILNRLKIGYVRHTANFSSPGTNGIPSLITIDALAGGFGASDAIPQFFTENEFQYKDDISVTHGKHTLKFGAEYRRTRNGSSFDMDKNGTFYSWGGEDLITDSTFSDQADMAIFGAPTVGSWYEAAAAVNPTNGQLPVFYRGYRANEVAMYGQDNWRILPRLTLNLGLRWEYFGPRHDSKKKTISNSNFGSPIPYPASGNPFEPLNNPVYQEEAGAVFQTRNTSIWNKHLTNFGPRAGFAWDILGNQKLVLRSGFGMYYDRIYNNVFENIRFNPPLYCDCTFGILQNGKPGGALETPGVFAVPLTAANTAAFVSPTLFPNGLPEATPRHMNQDLSTPYYEQYSFGLQYQLTKDMALETNYIGTLGRKLIGIYNLNTFDGRLSCPTSEAPFTSGPCLAAGFGAGFPTTRPNTTISDDNFRNTAFTSNYNALNVILRKRFSSGLQFNANYTFAKSLDELSDAFRGKGGIES